MKSRHVACFLILGVCLLSSFAVPAEGADPASLQVGVAKLDITPTEPVRLAGYASRTDLSKGIHDPLSLRTVVLKQGGKELVLVSAENLGFYRDTDVFVLDAVKAELGIPADNVFLSTIHTHSAPWLTLDEENEPPPNVRYTHFLKDQIVKAIRQARSELVQVKVGVGYGASAVGVNRREELPDGTVTLGRNPQGVHDQEVIALNFRKTDGQDLLSIFDYATHATSLGPGNFLVSGDLVGIASTMIEGWRQDAPAVALIGASGDIDPWYRIMPSFRSENGWISETEMLGRLLAMDVVRALEGIDSYDDAGNLASESSTLSLPGKKRGETAPSSDDPAPDVELRVSAARIGDIGLLGIGGEVLTEVGWAIKQGSPFKTTLVITHCNGSKGYLPPAHRYKEGGYEVETSPFAPAAADLVVKEALRLLHKLAASTE